VQHETAVRRPADRPLRDAIDEYRLTEPCQRHHSLIEIQPAVATGVEQHVFAVARPEGPVLVAGIGGERRMLARRDVNNPDVARRPLDVLEDGYRDTVTAGRQLEVAVVGDSSEHRELLAGAIEPGQLRSDKAAALHREAAFAEKDRDAAEDKRQTCSGR